MHALRAFAVGHLRSFRDSYKVPRVLATSRGISIDHRSANPCKESNDPAKRHASESQECQYRFGQNHEISVKFKYTPNIKRNLFKEPNNRYKFHLIKLGKAFRGLWILG